MQFSTIESFIIKLQKIHTIDNLADLQHQLNILFKQYNIPELDETLIKQSKKCRCHLTVLARIPEQYISFNAYHRTMRSYYFCLCPALDTLIFKTKSCTESRTHGHHFHYQCVSYYQLLDYNNFTEKLFFYKDDLQFIIN